MPLAYYVALPFTQTEDGLYGGETSQECQSEGAAIRRAERMSRNPELWGRSHSGVRAIRTRAYSPKRLCLRASATCRRISVSFERVAFATALHFGRLPRLLPHRRHGRIVGQ